MINIGGDGDNQEMVRELTMQNAMHENRIKNLTDENSEAQSQLQNANSQIESLTAQVGEQEQSLTTAQQQNTDL